MSVFDKIAKVAGYEKIEKAAADVLTGSRTAPSGSNNSVILGGAGGLLGGELPKPKPFDEVGTSGLLRTKGVGFVFEEWLNALSTHKQKTVYREMRDNDAVIGAMFFALEMILRKAEWRVEGAKGKKGDDQAEFVKSCIDDMSHTWEDFIAECVGMFAFGFALFETVYKRRQGPDGKKASRHDDGLIGWRKFAPRAQESILYWVWDEEGGLQGAVQLAAPDYQTVTLPIESLLLLRTTSLKNNPEGRSILRNCFRPWSFKRRLEEVEGIGIERDLCGIPVLKASVEAIEALGGMGVAKALVRNIRQDDQAGVVLPLVYDEKGNQMISLELIKAAGGRRTNPGDAIGRYNSDMLNTVLAGFVQFGQTPTGSRSLHMSATQIFALAIGAFMDSVAAVMNRIAIPRLLALNAMDLELAPKLVPGEIGVRDLEELADYVQKLSAGGLTFFDKDTENYLRKVGRLPDAPEGQTGGPPMPPGAVPPPGVPGAVLPPVPGVPPVPGQAPGMKPPKVKAPAPSGASPDTPKGANPPDGDAQGQERLKTTA